MNDRARPLAVRGDNDRLNQVLSNLLGNALGHTPAGGTVSLRTGSDGSMAFVDVIDTGAGIPADELERIFERFYRRPDDGVPATRPARAGRGIGLTIARSLARAQGGDVVASSAGTGSGSDVSPDDPPCRELSAGGRSAPCPSTADRLGDPLDHAGWLGLRDRHDRQVDAGGLHRRHARPERIIVTVVPRQHAAGDLGRVASDCPRTTSCNTVRHSANSVRSCPLKFQWWA